MWVIWICVDIIFIGNDNEINIEKKVTSTIINIFLILKSIRYKELLFIIIIDYEFYL